MSGGQGVAGSNPASPTFKSLYYEHLSPNESVRTFFIYSPFHHIFTIYLQYGRHLGTGCRGFFVTTIPQLSLLVLQVKGTEKFQSTGLKTKSAAKSFAIQKISDLQEKVPQNSF